MLLKRWQGWAINLNKPKKLGQPSTALDEKNAKFLVSSGLLWVHSADRVCGSDSPVKDELSTLKLLHDKMMMSAGRRSPNLMSTRSPTTKSSAFRVTFLPSLVASVNCVPL